MVGADDHAATLELKVNFVRAGAEGMPLTGVGRIEFIGGRTAVGMAHVRDKDGELVALGTATVSIRRVSYENPVRRGAPGQRAERES